MSKGKVKSIESTTRRIIARIESGEYDQERIQHMIQSLIKNRDQVIVNLKHQAKPRVLALSEGSISGALRDTINAHGTITRNHISSAAKRILGQCTRVVESQQTQSE